MSWGNVRRAIIFCWLHVKIAEKSEEMKFWDTKGFRFCTFFFFLPHRGACRILVPRLGMKSVPPALEAVLISGWGSP